MSPTPIIDTREKGPLSAEHPMVGSQCHQCGQPLAEGDTVAWVPSARGRSSFAVHTACVPTPPEAPEAPEAPAAGA